MYHTCILFMYDINNKKCKQKHTPILWPLRFTPDFVLFEGKLQHFSNYEIIKQLCQILLIRFQYLVKSTSSIKLLQSFFYFCLIIQINTITLSSFKSSINGFQMV